MRTSALIAAACLACAAAQAAGPRADTELAQRLIFEGTNAFRDDEGRHPVHRSPQLEAAARAFAQFMASTGKYGHEADGASPLLRARAHGYDHCIVSENIAYQYDSRGFTSADLAAKFVDGWKTSPGHRKNMLDPAVTDTAIAVAQGTRNGYYYAVQMFGRPKSLAVRFQVRNASATSVRYRLGEDSYTVSPGGIRTHMQCREEALAVQGMREGEPRVVAKNGDHFVVSGERGRVALRRE